LLTLDIEPQAAHDIVDGFCATYRRRREIDQVRSPRKRRKMAVGIDKTRQQRATSEFHNPCLWAYKLADLSFATDSRNALAIHRNSAGRVACHGDDVITDKNEFCASRGIRLHVLRAFLTASKDKRKTHGRQTQTAAKPESLRRRPDHGRTFRFQSILHWLFL
jgi:hypothetical protein